MAKINTEQVLEVAKLANLKLSDKLVSEFRSELEYILSLISSIQKLDTNNVPETHQATQAVNVTREDVIEPERVLPQSVVVKLAPVSHQGYIVVNRLIND